MADLINLRQARKRKRRAEKERDAAASRALHGRRADDVAKARLTMELDAARLEAHRRDRPGASDPEAEDSGPLTGR